MNKYLQDFLDICKFCFAFWGSFLFILISLRVIEEFSFGLKGEILLALATIGFVYLILSHGGKEEVGNGK